MSVSQLKSLTDRMKALLPWDEAEEVAFEAEPGTLTEQKLAALREIGVTRLSLGVENFDAHILEINGRAHRTDEIYRAYNYAKSIGFPQINIDLIAGMVEETDENWRANVTKTIELLPDSVTIYQMEVPYNTGIYKEMKAEGKLVAPVANWHTKRGWVDYAFRELEKVGYTVTSGYTAVRDPQKTKFVYRDELWKGADLIGLGVASFSHIAGTHFQNITEFTQYLDAIQTRRTADLARDDDDGGGADDPRVHSPDETRARGSRLLPGKIPRRSERTIQSAVRRSAHERAAHQRRRLARAFARGAAQGGHAAPRLLPAAASRHPVHMIAAANISTSRMLPHSLPATAFAMSTSAHERLALWLTLFKTALPGVRGDRRCGRCRSRTATCWFIRAT